MNVVAWIVGIVLAVAFLGAGGSKLVDAGPARRHLGYTLNQWRLIGVAELAAVAGIVVGLVWRGLEFVAIAAGVGLAVTMLGALMAHARVEDDTKDIAPAAVLLVLSVLFIVFVAIR